MYWDDNSLTVVPYERKQKKYTCGKKLDKPKENRNLKYIILILDLSEAYCANVFDDGTIEKIFDLTSTVPTKHKQGGQSQRRFERIREGCIIEWFKRLNQYLKEVEGKIYVGINFVYKERFCSYLSTENLNKIVSYDRTEYTGFTGVHQFWKMLEKN